MYERKYVSPVGDLFLTSDGTVLTGLYMEVPAFCEDGECPVLDRAQAWLDDYFRGYIRPADFPLSPRGTAFQQRVWEQLKSIPYGTVCTYGDIAREIGCRSAQAVGQAVGANPISILIPCHRVIGTKGKLTGYAWGIEKKKWLLEHEKQHDDG